MLRLRGILVFCGITSPPLNSVAVSLINHQSLVTSSSVVLCDVTVNRMTYFPFNDDGTACILPIRHARLLFISLENFYKRMKYVCIFSFLPDPFNFFKSFSVISFSPLSRKTTIPMCLSAGISKRSSEATKASNCFAKWTPLNHIKIGLRAYYGQ